MLCMTASAPSRCCVYDAGSSMSPFCHEIFSAQSGGFGEEETEDQWGMPERLGRVRDMWKGECGFGGEGVVTISRLRTSLCGRRLCIFDFLYRCVSLSLEDFAVYFVGSK